MNAPPSRCDVCGFCYDAVTISDAPDRISAAAAELGTLVSEAGPAAHEHKDPTTWSALEYAGHVRDVLLSMRERIILTAMLDQPVGTPLYREERITLGIDRLDTPAAVAQELTVVARLLGRTLQALPEGAASRTMTYSTLTPIDASISWMAAQAVHESEHHLAEARSALPGQ